MKIKNSEALHAAIAELIKNNISGPELNADEITITIPIISKTGYSVDVVLNQDGVDIQYPMLSVPELIDLDEIIIPDDIAMDTSEDLDSENAPITVSRPLYRGSGESSNGSSNPAIRRHRERRLKLYRSGRCCVSKRFLI